MPKLQDSFRSPIALQVNPLAWESELLGWPIDWTFSNEERSLTTTSTIYTDLMSLEPGLLPDHTCWSYISQFYESLPTGTSLEVRSDDIMGQNFEPQEQEFLLPESQLTTTPQTPHKPSKDIHEEDRTIAHKVKEEDKHVSYPTLSIATPELEAQSTDTINIYSDEIPRGDFTQVDGQNMSVDRGLSAHQTFYNAEENTSHPEIPIGQHNFLPSFHPDNICFTTKSPSCRAVGKYDFDIFPASSQSFAPESSTRGKRKGEEPKESSGFKRVKLLGHSVQTSRDIENIPIPNVSSSPQISYKRSRVYKRKEPDMNPDRIQKEEALRMPLGEMLRNGLPVNVLSNNIGVGQPIVPHGQPMPCVPAPEPCSKRFKRKRMEEEQYMETPKVLKLPRRVAPCTTSGEFSSKIKYESDDEYLPSPSRSSSGRKKNKQEQKSRASKTTKDRRTIGQASNSGEEDGYTGLIPDDPTRPWVCPEEGCGKWFTRLHDRNRHTKSIHSPLDSQKTLFCPWALKQEKNRRKCKDSMSRIDSLGRHIRTMHVSDNDEHERWMEKIKKAVDEGSYTPERVKSWFNAEMQLILK
ncbi:hypothetical protein GALMADRAFT_210190 [Galerina marginata CBS 339.88]|uniref:C2H2-type domain-containing protein n=1 Tax=Galerina marginata (strain CBS 339.88) TaxID=685588 RepID=A0A067TAX1_GALM3|nr:hypothetical protein GALMADRAFT_210190 [Galerina marginata CBS 339.88]